MEVRHSLLVVASGRDAELNERKRRPGCVDAGRSTLPLWIEVVGAGRARLTNPADSDGGRDVQLYSWGGRSSGMYSTLVYMVDATEQLFDLYLQVWEMSRSTTSYVIAMVANEPNDARRPLPAGGK